MSGAMQDADEPMLLAGEYVLGVLQPEEMQAVTVRALTDSALAGEIAEWRMQLSPLALLVTPVAPPPELWERISRAIGGGGVPVPTAVSQPIDAAPSASERAARFWRNLSFASIAVAAALAFIVFVPPRGETVALATLAPLDAARPAFVARVLANGDLKVAALEPRLVPSGHDLELWALPPGAKAVVALGVLPAEGLSLPKATLAKIGGRLLVSLEPTGGSPTGQPTGPVLYGGTITRM